MPLRTRKRLILAKLEGSNYGTDSSPAAANAIRVTNLDITPVSPSVVSRDLIRGFLGASPTLVAENSVACTVEVEWTGGGAAGTAPQWGVLALACASAQTITAAPVTGTPTAGGSNTLTLAVGASAVDDFYLGLPLTITAGTGVGRVFLVTGYVGSTRVATLAPFTGTAATLDATSAYSISANTTYTPVTDVDGVTDTSITLYYFVENVLHKFTGSRGTFSLAAQRGQIPKLSFQYIGIFQPVTDTTPPVPIYPTDVTPQVFRRVNSGAFGFLGHAGCLDAVSFDCGNDVQYRDLIGCSESVQIVDRASNGSVTIEAPNIAQKNYFASALDDALGGSGALHFMHGTAAGNRSILFARNCDLGAPSYQDSQGIHHLVLPFTAVPTGSGNNEWRLVSA
jgi:hypothetical protein